MLRSWMGLNSSSKMIMSMSSSSTYSLISSSLPEPTNVRTSGLSRLWMKVRCLLGRFSQEGQLLQVLFELFATLVPGGEPDEDARFGRLGCGEGFGWFPWVKPQFLNFSMYTAMPRMVGVEHPAVGRHGAFP